MGTPPSAQRGESVTLDLALVIFTFLYYETSRWGQAVWRIKSDNDPNEGTDVAHQSTRSRTRVHLSENRKPHFCTSLGRGRYGRDLQVQVPRPALLPWGFLEIWIIEPQLRPGESETLNMGAAICILMSPAEIHENPWHFQSFRNLIDSFFSSASVKWHWSSIFKDRGEKY